MAEHKLFEVYMNAERTNFGSIIMSSEKRYSIFYMQKYFKANGTTGYYRLKSLLRQLEKDIDESYNDYIILKQ